MHSICPGPTDRHELSLERSLHNEFCPVCLSVRLSRRDHQRIGRPSDVNWSNGRTGPNGQIDRAQVLLFVSYP